jgi:hypothetical protein
MFAFVTDFVQLRHDVASAYLFRLSPDDYQEL